MRRVITNIIFSIIFAATLFPASATAYCLKGKTASGEPVRNGICAGGNRYFGKTVSVYKRLPDGSVGDYIGSYECKDKGGTDAIRKNYVIDIWQEDLDACQEFMNLVYEDGCKGKVYICIEDEI